MSPLTITRPALVSGRFLMLRDVRCWTGTAHRQTADPFRVRGC